MEARTNIDIWWEYSFKQGQFIQTIENLPEDNQIDSQSIWKGIESQVPTTGTGLRYNESLIPIYKKMDILCDKYDAITNKSNLKSYHLFMQLQNLISKNSNFEIKLNLLLHLAYIAGQLSHLIQLKKIPEDITQCIMENNLLSLDTYVSKENQAIINKKYLDNTHLDKVRENIHMLGGGVTEDNYYFKYLKYKYKYLLEKKLKK